MAYDVVTSSVISTFLIPSSPIAFLLQQQDLQYMVEKFWGAQSALSAWDDLYDLVMVRWDKYHEWSPWNTVLLTKDEAEAHLKLTDLEKVHILIKCGGIFSLMFKC